MKPPVNREFSPDNSIFFEKVMKISLHIKSVFNHIFSFLAPAIPGPSGMNLIPGSIKTCVVLLILLAIGAPALSEPREIAVTSSRDWFTKAVEYQSVNKLDQAMECLEIALDLNPRNLQAQELYEKLSGNNGGPSPIATRDIPKTQSRTSDVQNFYQKAKDYMAKGELKQARDCLEIALEMDENNFEIKGLLDRVVQKIKYQDFRTGRVVVQVPLGQPGKSRVHIVKKGDTLGKIAKEYLGSFKEYETIARYNNMKPKDVLTIGQAIRIPPTNNIVDILPTEIANIQPLSPAELGGASVASQVIAQTSVNTSRDHRGAVPPGAVRVSDTGWYEVKPADSGIKPIQTPAQPASRVPADIIPLPMESPAASPAAVQPIAQPTAPLPPLPLVSPVTTSEKPPIFYKPIPPKPPVKQETIFSVTPKTAADYSALARAFWKIGELEKAMDNYRKAIKMDPTLMKKSQSKLVDEAILNLQERNSGDPDAFASLHFKLAEIYQKRGELESASQELLRAIELKDDFEEAYFNLGFIYEKLGETELAIMTYEKVNEMFAARDEVVSMATDRITRLVDIRRTGDRN